MCSCMRARVCCASEGKTEKVCSFVSLCIACMPRPLQLSADSHYHFPPFISSPAPSSLTPCLVRALSRPYGMDLGICSMTTRVTGEEGGGEGGSVGCICDAVYWSRFRSLSLSRWVLSKDLSRLLDRHMGSHIHTYSPAHVPTHKYAV